MIEPYSPEFGRGWDREERKPARALAENPAIVERVAEILWVENERWHRQNATLSKRYVYPYSDLIEPTREDLRTYARAVLHAIAEDELVPIS